MAGLVILLIAGYLLFHLGHGHANMRHARAAGLRPSVYWRAGMRGPWVSIRGPAGFRIGHRL